MFRYFLVLVSGLLLSCGSDKHDEPDSTPVLQGIVLSASNDSPIEGANVVVINLKTNATVGRQLTGPDGRFSFELDSGSYSFEIQGSGFLDYPTHQGGGMVVTIPRDSGVTVTMNPNPTIGAVGSIAGSLAIDSGSVAGTLIVAINGNQAISTAAGPDGSFLLLNVPAGTWTLEFYKSGLMQTGAEVTALVTANKVINTSGEMQVHPGARIAGSVSFLATTAKNIDVTLVHPLTHKAIPGLSVRTDSGNSFVLNSVPPGNFIAWASYQNDSIVMDPDWIRKSGLPTITVLAADTALSIDFSCTGAITLMQPTNPMDSIYSVELDSIPVFTWIKQSSYASAHEYIIEVFNEAGKRVWGGYDTDLLPLHQPILATNNLSVAWNFDTTATDSLVPGNYRWKVYAVKVIDKKGVITRELLSASEDLLGLFKIMP